jgi:hypothetical protein
MLKNPSSPGLLKKVHMVLGFARDRESLDQIGPVGGSTVLAEA